MPGEEALYSLVVRMEAENRKLHAELRRSTREVRRFRQDTTGHLSAVTKAFNKLKSLTIAGFSTAAIAGFSNQLKEATKSAISETDAIIKNARAVGLSSSAYQELGFSAEESGVSQGEFTAALLAFRKRVGEAKEGTGSLASYLRKYDETLLTTIQNTSSQEQAINVLSDAIAREGDETKRASLAAAAFSRGGVKMELTLRGGSKALDEARKKAEDLGQVFHVNDAEVESLNDEFGRLQRKLDIEAKQAFINAGANVFLFDKAINSLKVSAINATVELAKLFNLIDKSAEEEFQQLIISRQELTKQISQISIDFPETASFRDELQKDLDAVNEKIAEIIDARKKLDETKPAPVTAPTPVLEISDEHLQNQIEIETKLIEQNDELEEQAKHYRELADETLVLRREIEQITELQRRGLISPDVAEANIKRVRQQLGATVQEEVSPEEHLQQQIQIEQEIIAQNDALDYQAQRYKEILDPTIRFREQLAEIGMLKDKNKLSDEEALMLVQKIQVQWKQYEDVISGVADKQAYLKNVIVSIGNISNAWFSDFLFGAASASDAIKGLIEDLARLAERLLFEQYVLSPLLGGIFGSNPSAPTGLTAAATGGPVKANMPYVANEMGQELFIPKEISISSGMKTGEPYLIQGDGPTLFIPPEDGEIIPAGKTKSIMHAQYGGNATGGIPMIVNESGTEMFVPDSADRSDNVIINQSFDFTGANPATLALLRSEAMRIKNDTISTMVNMRTRGALPNF